MFDRRLLKNFDFKLVLIILALITYGIFMIESASRGSGKSAQYVDRQIVWALVGFVLFAAAAAVDYQVLLRSAKSIYVGNILVLTAVLLIGASAKGAQRWIDIGPLRLQPSEFAKLAIIVTLAAFLVKHADRIRDWRVVVKSFIHIAVPMLLIFKQPDLGTSLVLVVIWFGMLFIAGASVRHLAAFVLAGLVMATVVWHTGMLKDYQKARLTVFINPDADPRGAGYHIRQSRIAIGSGQFYGKGLFHGTQSRLRFIPEQHTDFIFTVVGEELGFMGGAALVLLYFGLVWRGIVTMADNEDFGGRLIAAGIVSMFVFHVVINIGMTLGIMPVTGVPLPLFSYGGSNLMANLLTLGLLARVHMRRHKITF